MRDFFHSRLALVCYCAIGALTGWMLRDDRPVEVATKLEDARALIYQAVESQNAALAEYTAKQIHNVEAADLIEADAIPSLRQAIRMIDEAASVGAKGESFDTFAAYARTRLQAAETIAESLRSSDQAQFDVGKRLTEEAVRLGKSLRSTGTPTEDMKRPAVIHLGS